MRLVILHNDDHLLLSDDPGREARKDVVRSAEAIAKALGEKGLVVELSAVRDVAATAIALHDDRPDLVINLCESLAADSRGEMLLPCLLDQLGISYTGSSALSLGLALHKHKAKELLLARGVPTPAFKLVETLGELASLDPAELPFPLIVKPSREDASVGVDFDSVVTSRAALGQAVARVLQRFHQPALVERYVEGREIYVSLLGNHPALALPLTEIAFGHAFDGRPHIVSYRAKWELESPEFTDSPSCPCQLPAEVEQRVVETARSAFAALEGRDYGRVDVRLSDDGVPYVIDVNPNCDLHPQAGFAKAAAEAGIAYPDLALHLVEIALDRRHGNTNDRLSRPAAARRAVGPNRNLHAARGGMRARAHRSRAQG